MSSTNLKCVMLSCDAAVAEFMDDDLADPTLLQLGIETQTLNWNTANVDWQQFDLVIVRTTWDYQDDVPAFLSALQKIDDAGTPLANPLDVLRWNARKTYLADLERAGIRIVPTVFGEALDVIKLGDLSRRYATGEWILKPDIGANSGGVFRLLGKPDDTTTSALLERFASGGYLAQPFVEQVTRTGEYSVFYFDGQYSHSILKTPRDGDFRVQEDYGANIRAVAPPNELLTAAQGVLQALPDNCLYVRIDLVADADDQWCVMEVELIEPSLYLRTTPEAPVHFANAVRRWYDRQQT